jgi:hypothetical protein
MTATLTNRTVKEIVGKTEGPLSLIIDRYIRKGLIHFEVFEMCAGNGRYPLSHHSAWTDKPQGKYWGRFDSRSFTEILCTLEEGQAHEAYELYNAERGFILMEAIKKAYPVLWDGTNLHNNHMGLIRGGITVPITGNESLAYDACTFVTFTQEEIDACRAPISAQTERVPVAKAKSAKRAT